MNRMVLSEVLDGAAFPAVMLALAVSQINGDPSQRNTLDYLRNFQWGKSAELKAKKAQGH